MSEQDQAMRHVARDDHFHISADPKSHGGGSHIYTISSRSCNEDGSGVSQQVRFQQGPVKEHGLNGIQNEHLVQIVIDRLSGFQAGPCHCKENGKALDKLEEALLWLDKRTADRKARGVEGQYKA